MPDINWSDFKPAPDQPVLGLAGAIRHVESGGDPDAVSSQGATGSMQIEPATFRQYARPGEDFGNDTHRSAAALRKIVDDYVHFGGDVSKTAAAYIGGRGAVRGDGTIRDDVADANGTTPAAYVQKVMGRIQNRPKVDWSQFTPVAEAGGGRGFVNPAAADPRAAPPFLHEDHGPADESDPLTRITPSTPGGSGDFAVTPQLVAGAGRGTVNPPLIGETPLSVVRNFRGGMLQTVAGAGETAATALGAEGVAANLNEQQQELQQDKEEHGGNSIAGKAASLVGSVVPAMLVPAGRAAQLVGNAGLFAMPAFQHTLQTKLEEGQSFPLALAHAAEAFGVNLFLPTVATRGSGAVVKALGGAEATGARGAATAIGQAAAEGAGFSVANSVLDKGTDVIAGQQNDRDWVDLQDVAANALGFPVLRAAHMAPQAASAIADRVGTRSQQFGRALGQDVDAAQFDPNYVPGVRVNPNLAKVDPITRIAKAATVDEAIQAAQEAVSAVPVAKADLPGGQTIEQLLAQERARQGGAPSVADAIRPLEPERDPVLAQARDLLAAVDAGGIPLNPAKLRSIAEGLGLEVRPEARPEATIGRIRLAVARAGNAEAEPAKKVEMVSTLSQGEPAATWFGRAGDGYKTAGDAQMALPSRLKIAPTLNWSVERMPNGKFRLAGYAEEGAPSGDGQADTPRDVRVPADAAALAGDALPHPAVDGAGEPGDVRGIGEGRPQGDAVSAAGVEPVAPAIGGAEPAGVRDHLDRAAAGLSNAPELARDPFRTFLIRNGIALRLARDFAPGTRERLAMSRTFRRDGLELDLLAQRAAEQGFIRDPHDTDSLYDLISRSVNGERIGALYGRDGEAELQARMAQHRQQQEDTAVAALRSLEDNELFEVADAIPDLDAPSNVTTEAAMRTLGFTEQEIADAIAQESRGAQASGPGRGGAGEAAAGKAPGARGAGEGQARADDAAGLSRPTREDVLAQQDRAKEGERASNQAKEDAQRRVSADAQRAEFGLTGSDRAADSNPGQGDLTESDQDRSHREFAENFDRVANAPDITKVSTRNLERAEAYAEQRRASELRKGWDGEKEAVNQSFVEAMDRELEHMRAELKQRRNPAPADKPPPDQQRQLIELRKRKSVLESLLKCLE